MRVIYLGDEYVFKEIKDYIQVYANLRRFKIINGELHLIHLKLVTKICNAINSICCFAKTA